MILLDQTTPGEGLSARPAARADAGALAGLVRRAFAAQPVAADPPPSALRETGEAIAAHMAKGGAWLIACGDTPVAACLWSIAGDTMRLSRLAVDPHWRRRGLARALLVGIAADARALGLARIRIETRLPLVGNRRLFAAAGYREIALHAHPGYAEPTFVEMELLLDAAANTSTASSPSAAAR